MRTLRKRWTWRGNGQRCQQKDRRGTHSNPERFYLRKCAHHFHRRNPSRFAARRTSKCAHRHRLETCRNILHVRIPHVKTYFTDASTGNETQTFPSANRV